MDLLTTSPGLTDREITDRLAGRQAPQQTVNQMCRGLEKEGRLTRRARHDGLLGNHPRPVTPRDETSRLNIPNTVTTAAGPNTSEPLKTFTFGSGRPAGEADADGWLSEDDVKRHVAAWLEGQGWQVAVAWGRTRGLDIRAERDGERWLIEAKGGGSLPAMRVNYFLAILGETLQRMEDPGARYSIALPGLRQFKGLWMRLPDLAKKRLRVTALFVNPDGTVEELKGTT